MENFSECANLDRYHDVPDDWWVATGDVIDSTGAIERGMYKAVNAAGVACITSIINAVGERDIPFVFGGDGGTALIPNSAKEEVTRALVGVRKMVKKELKLDLRVGLVSVQSLRAANHSVKVARFRLSPQAVLAFFAGDGLEAADRWLKSGKVAILDDHVEGEADFTGFECRWNPLPARNDQVVAILIQALNRDDHKRTLLYQDLVERIRELMGGWSNVAPVELSNMSLALTPMGAGAEVMVRYHSKSVFVRILQMMRLWWSTIVTVLWLKLGSRQSSVRKYFEETVANSDYQKFDGALRMILDLSSEQYAKLRDLLESSYKIGDIFYGLHSSDSALMTCMVFSRTNDHLHFIDGNNGGYAIAADQIKKQREIRRSQERPIAS